MTHLELFDVFQSSQARSNAWPWRLKPQFWRRTSFRGCSVKHVTRENQDEVKAAGPDSTRDVKAVTCPHCLVSLDKLLAASQVKLTARGKVSFIGRFARYRTKTMKDHYKALAFNLVEV